MKLINFNLFFIFLFLNKMFHIVKEIITQEEKQKLNGNYEKICLCTFQNIDDFTIHSEFKNIFNINEQFFKDLWKYGEHEIYCYDTFDVVYDNKHVFKITKINQ